MNRVYLAILICLFLIAGNAQQTVGVFINNPQAFDGYSLFAPFTSHTTYLIDNCGRLVHQWPSSYEPAASVYLMEDGSILRTAHINSSFIGGGSGGRIERISWEGELTWTYNYSTSEKQQHHDIEPMPNDHILVIAWEKVSRAEAIEMGRNPATAPFSGLWPDHIIEIAPVDSSDATIVWEWHSWDHLVQDFDSTKLNFGVVADHPELIDLNFAAVGGFQGADWLHFNAVDYNPELDQILICAHNFNEIWIIDHGTTTEEAAGHTGGKFGQGGDILYRWGNPQAYRRGMPSDKIFNGQHDARWVDAGLPGAGQISVYNNNHGLGQNGYSSADYFAPAMDSTGIYVFDGERYGPADLAWSYDGLPDNKFYSSRLSSVQRLPNGNTLICVGNDGRFFEVTEAGEVVWDYVNPVSGNQVLSQGTIPSLNTVFRVERFAPDFEGFTGRDMTPGEPLELTPLPLICPDTVSSVGFSDSGFGISVTPNPVFNTMTVFNPEFRRIQLDVFSCDRRLMYHRRNLEGSEIQVDANSWPQGLSIVMLTDETTMERFVMKLVKL